MKDKFLALVDVLEGLGKEVLAFCCLVSGLFLLIKGYLAGERLLWRNRIAWAFIRFDVSTTQVVWIDAIQNQPAVKTVNPRFPPNP